MTALILHETAAEGAYVATVKAYGTEFAAHYIKGEIRLYGVAGNLKAGWKNAGAAKAARKAVAARIEALGAKLYAEEV